MLILADWELSDLKSFYWHFFLDTSELQCENSKAPIQHDKVRCCFSQSIESPVNLTKWVCLKMRYPEKLPNYQISSTYQQHIIIIHHISSCSPFFMAIFGGIRYTGIPHSQTVVKKMVFALGLWQRGSSTWNAMANLWSSWALHRRGFECNRHETYHEGMNNWP